ncbi:hypothetical protein PtB15_7B196 [Puccinia triticina]|nr:hypothetical protein PtB15_7B196 [Puccinia triticina]
MGESARFCADDLFNEPEASTISSHFDEIKAETDLSQLIGGEVIEGQIEFLNDSIAKFKRDDLYQQHINIQWRLREEAEEKKRQKKREYAAKYRANKRLKLLAAREAEIVTMNESTAVAACEADIATNKNSTAERLGGDKDERMDNGTSERSTGAGGETNKKTTGIGYSRGDGAQANSKTLGLRMEQLGEGMWGTGIRTKPLGPELPETSNNAI